MNKNPRVSVILPVYNGERTLADSIDSILNQEFKDLELIIINDGSSDKSLEICERYKNDTRVRIINQVNHGLAKTLNIGIRLSRGEIIARQDQDDISLPGRIYKQIQFIDQNPRVVLVGTWSKVYSEGQDTGRRHHHPLSDRELRHFLYFDNPFVHSSVVFKRENFLQAGGYISMSDHQPEDYDLWTRISETGEIANLPFYGLHYHETPISMSRGTEKPFPMIYKISARYFAKRTNSNENLSERWGALIWGEKFGLNPFELLYCAIKIIVNEKSVSRLFLRRVASLLKIQMISFLRLRMNREYK